MATRQRSPSAHSSWAASSRATPRLVRLQQELKYARIAARAIRDAKPDVVVLSNVPLLSMFFLTRTLRRRRTRYVFWHQDIYSDAIGVVARRRLGRDGPGDRMGRASAPSARSPAGRQASSRSVTRSSKNSMPGVSPGSAIHVIPNWGAIDEMPLRPKDNEWSRSQGLADVPVVMYAGTLGLEARPVGAVPAGAAGARGHPRRRGVARPGPGMAGRSGRQHTGPQIARLSTLRAVTGHACQLPTSLWWCWKATPVGTPCRPRP